jgi:dGTPase
MSRGGPRSGVARDLANESRAVSVAGERDRVAACFAQNWREREERLLSPLAARSYPALRAHAEDDCALRTPFQRDRDRIVHSKAFRRLTHKTQVFVAPRGDHYRTRLTHTLEVTTISRTVARALSLNEDLVEAIGLGHDLGHPPFGHIGEEVLDSCLKERFGRDFRHYEHSLRIVERLERDGAGLNLTEQVRDGIARHSSRAPTPHTLEGRIVRVIDRVAYINHDIDDAVRAGLLRERDLPREPIEVLGGSGSARIDALVHDMVEHSAQQGDIVQGPDAGPAMAELRDFMFERVYLGPAVRAEHRRIASVVRRLFEHYVAHPELLPGAVVADGGRGAAADDEGASAGSAGEEWLAEAVTDYLAGMTDRYCIREYTELQVPQAFAR